MVYVAILGHGVVGSGVAEVLRKNADSIAHKAGEPIEIRRILDLREFPDLPYADKFTKEFDDILHDPDIRIVVETMGGLHPAYDFVKSCLLAGKNVVTSNKELVAAKGDELLEIAKNNNLNFLFEASVGGGIPILRPIDQCLAANEVYEIAGILNGTTNFMLTRMIEDHMSFEDALALAQKLGYAERNPSADVDGHDACRKICILASLAFGKHVYPEQIHTEGIGNITLDDVKFAEAYGGVIKLIGRVLCGRGAGKLPTASAVVADVIDEVKHLGARKYLFWERGAEGYVCDWKENAVSALVRFRCPETHAALAQVNAVFSGAAIVSAPHAPADQLAFVTPSMTEAELDAKLASLQNMTLLSRLRVAEL